MLKSGVSKTFSNHFPYLLFHFGKEKLYGLIRDTEVSNLPIYRNFHKLHTPMCSIQYTVHPDTRDIHKFQLDFALCRHRSEFIFRVIQSWVEKGLE